MGGFLGIGGSSAKTDRATQLAAQQGNWNIFNWALPQGEAGQTSGLKALEASEAPLSQAQQYFSSLLSGGRQQTAQNAAPAIDAALGQETLTRDQAEAFGTSRVGGTAALNREASQNTQSTIDQIINQNLVAGQAAGAAGLEQVSAQQESIANSQLANSLSLLGLSQSSINAIMTNATESRSESFSENQAMQQQWESVLSGLLQAPEQISGALNA